jgi:hypothetical protein
MGKMRKSNLQRREPGYLAPGLWSAGVRTGMKNGGDAPQMEQNCFSAAAAAVAGGAPIFRLSYLKQKKRAKLEHLQRRRAQAVKCKSLDIVPPFVRPTTKL